MKAIRILCFVMVLALTLAAAVVPAFAASGSTGVSFIPGVLKISDISVDPFRLISEAGGLSTYSARIGDFTVTDARGSGLGWSVLAFAEAIPQGGSLVIEGMSGEAAKGANEFYDSYIDAQHAVSSYPSAFINVPEGGGKGTYSFSGTELLLTIPAGDQAEIKRMTITIEVVSNTI